MAFTETETTAKEPAKLSKLKIPEYKKGIVNIKDDSAENIDPLDFIEGDPTNEEIIQLYNLLITNPSIKRQTETIGRATYKKALFEIPNLPGFKDQLFGVIVGMDGNGIIKNGSFGGDNYSSLMDRYAFEFIKSRYLAYINSSKTTSRTSIGGTISDTDAGPIHVLPNM